MLLLAGTPPLGKDATGVLIFFRLRHGSRSDPSENRGTMHRIIHDMSSWPRLLRPGLELGVGVHVGRALEGAELAHLLLFRHERITAEEQHDATT